MDLEKATTVGNSDATDCNANFKNRLPVQTSEEKKGLIKTSERTKTPACNASPSIGREAEACLGTARKSRRRKASRRGRQQETTKQAMENTVEACGLVQKMTWVAIVINFILCICCFVAVYNTDTSPPCPSHPCPSCPSGWTTHERKCFYFSEEENSWNASQSNCSSSGASLATIDTKQEWDFIMRYKRPADHWFGLRRQEINQPWRWTNGSDFNSSLFQIGANGYCAFLNDNGASSTLCETKRNWICSKSLSSF